MFIYMLLFMWVHLYFTECLLKLTHVLREGTLNLQQKLVTQGIKFNLEKSDIKCMNTVLLIRKRLIAWRGLDMWENYNMFSSHKNKLINTIHWIMKIQHAEQCFLQEHRFRKSIPHYFCYVADNLFTDCVKG